MSNNRAEAWEAIGDGEARGGVLIVADHASAHVPPDIDLGIPAEIMTRHVAIDIGVAPLAKALCARMGWEAILGGVSRLVCDFNREEDAPGLIPLSSDGIDIAANHLDAEAREVRLARFFRPYHGAVAAAIARRRPALIVSLHSFTPRLETRPEERRPWEIGILYNQDERAARIAIPLLKAAGIATGDNKPYSGRLLNATMNRHAEGAGIPYLGIEVRQDLIGEEAGVTVWADRLAPVIGATWDRFAQKGPVSVRLQA
ncbi:N-formylglutamate amidohydrolase [Sphingomonas sp. CGMCC 1.13654]|uniref:N-formylglutamate amidohydrolase n=1 Tax=Sphingomonas chungangi TaxID=2683589 RepID=A0A838LBW5_9SPHN|nr:N-formylglutamate amidohydrolase [Sphingomonas chungangi]MBA2936350.1 N-formylglutamate amidohydrolase [Sphingomonas chungangi]MVW55735.1 N-formylglutamate amidohydrolase [Sphingomonas chungangi]